MLAKTVRTVAVLSFAALFCGCQSSTSNPTSFEQSNKILSEADFATGKAVHANENHIVILSLEPPSGARPISWRASSTI